MGGSKTHTFHWPDHVTWSPGDPLNTITLNGMPLPPASEVIVTHSTHGSVEITVTIPEGLDLTPPLGSMWHSPACYSVTVVGQMNKQLIPCVVWNDGPSVKFGHFMTRELHQPQVGCLGR